MGRFAPKCCFEEADYVSQCSTGGAAEFPKAQRFFSISLWASERGKHAYGTPDFQSPKEKVALRTWHLTEGPFPKLLFQLQSRGCLRANKMFKRAGGALPKLKHALNLGVTAGGS